MLSIDLKPKTSRRKAVKKIGIRDPVVEPVVVCPTDWPGPVPTAWNHEPLPEPEPEPEPVLDETMYDDVPQPKIVKPDIKVTCPCGATVSKKSLSKHIKTDKHLKLFPEANVL